MDNSKPQSRLSKVEEYFKCHLPQYNDLPHFGEWLKWATLRGFLIAVWSDQLQQEIMGAAIVRPVIPARLEDLALLSVPYDFDEDGQILVVDAAVASNANALRAIGLGIMQRFGARKSVAFNSHNRGLRIHDFNQARIALFKHAIRKLRIIG